MTKGGGGAFSLGAAGLGGPGALGAEAGAGAPGGFCGGCFCSTFFGVAVPEGWLLPVALAGSGAGGEVTCAGGAGAAEVGCP